MFLFMMQAFTGALLAFNYAPTPGDAYNSLRYILTELTGGRLIRGLHHWGASMMIVVVVLHMVQVFLYGAYKKPREATWMVGVVLLLLTLAYGLTGYLLPWDNRAYWGTVVTTQIAAQAPVAGAVSDALAGRRGRRRRRHLRALLRNARAAAAAGHALPDGLHVYLVRKHGVAPAPGDEVRPKKKFYPQQVFKDTVAIFIAFAILFMLAVAVRVPLEQLADPTDTTYIPAPRMVFPVPLPDAEAVQRTAGSGGQRRAAGAGGAAADPGAVHRPRRHGEGHQRTVAFAVVLLAAIGWGGLTAAAVRRRRRRPWRPRSTTPGPPTGCSFRPRKWPASAISARRIASSCHADRRPGTAVGPDLTKAAIHKDAAWMIQHFKRPARDASWHLDAADSAQRLAVELAGGVPAEAQRENASALDNAPDFAVQGALVYQANRCGACHVVNGGGMKVGPPLNGLSKRQSRSWVEDHFADPQKMSPGSIMPPYKLRPRTWRT